jgi:hypothetical protein
MKTNNEIQNGRRTDVTPKGIDFVVTTICRSATSQIQENPPLMPSPRLINRVHTFERWFFLRSVSIPFSHLCIKAIGFKQWGRR